MFWRDVTLKDGQQSNLVEIPEEWLYLHYYQALSALFRIENSLRVFAYIVLKNEFFEKWDKLSIRSDDDDPGTIASIAKKRIAQASVHGYLGYPVKCCLLQLTGGELIRLMMSDSYWKFFSSYFPGQKEIIASKLAEIAAVRNSLAHFRPIRKEDVDVVQQNARQVMSKVDETLSELVRSTDKKETVPSNNVEDWHSRVRFLKSENCTFSFHQTVDQNWINIRLNYSCPLIDHSIRKYRSHQKILTLLSSGILVKLPTLRNLVTFVSEDVTQRRTAGGYCVDFDKQLNLLFRRDVLSKHNETIALSLEDLMTRIEEQTQMIRTDHNAVGDLVASVEVSAVKRDNSDEFIYDLKPMLCNINESDPPEYWGSLDTWAGSFVTGLGRFPWMPVEVSLGIPL
jgi:hypothetical protein